MKDIFEKVVKGRAFEYAVVPTAAIVFSPELIKSCEANLCGKYNHCWTCPPAIASVEQHKKLITAWVSAFVFTTTAALEDSFDYEGMMEAKDYHDHLTREMHERFGKTNPVFGAGGCTICPVCAYPEPCKFPDKTFSSIEAAGINVTDLSRAGGLRYNNGVNTVTYFSMILF